MQIEKNFKGERTGVILKTDGFFINNPVFCKIKREFNWRTFSREKCVKFVFINERIVEIPFAISVLADISRSSRILDLGCAESLMPMQLVGMGFHVTGVDFRNYPYDLPNFTFERADILKLPMADASFDACTCISTLEHIGIGHYDDPLYNETADFEAMAQVHRVLTTGGKLILTVPFGKTFQGKLQRVYDSARLDRLLKGFRIEQKIFCVSRKKDGAINNFWHPVSEHVAADVPGGDRTDCVCLVRAVKILA